MEQKKILLKSLDVQPFLNEDEYINIELVSSAREIKQNYLSNDFNLKQQYDNERNSSRKFFIYGRLFAKQVNTDGLKVTLKTSDNDVLYVPNKKNNILPPGTTTITVVTKSVTDNTSLSKNIFGNTESAYYFQFEIDGNNTNSGKTKNAILTVEGNQIENEFSKLLIYFDSDNNFVPYGTIDTIFDSNFNFVEINNDLPFLYDCHWVKNNMDIVTFNNLYFPFKQFQDNNGNTIIDNSTQITDSNLKPTFKILMDYPSFFGLEKATLNITKSVKPRNDYYVPLRYFDSQIFEKYSPWEGYPQNQFQWNLVGGALSNIRNIIVNNNSYPNFNIFNTSQQFYDANIGYFLSFFDGCNLSIQNEQALYDNLIIKGFLDYSSSVYKKDISATYVGEFISGFTQDSGQIIDTVDISFAEGDSSESYVVNLSGITFYNEMEYLSVDIKDSKNVNIGNPNNYFINVIAENKKPTATFLKNYDVVSSENFDYELEVNLDKPFQGLNPITLSLSVEKDKTTAISFEEAATQNINYPFTIDFSQNGNIKHDYEILNNNVTISKGDSKAVFKIRIYYSNSYFLDKNLMLNLSSSSNEVLTDQLNNIFSLKIKSSVIPGWTKYQFPANSTVGIGMFRSNRIVGYSNVNYLFEIESPKINNTSNRLNFTPNFNYTISCINAGDTEVSYGGDYGGEQKNVQPGETMFSVDSIESFEYFDFVLPSNSNLVEVYDVNTGIITPKYLNSKYEFKIKNIEPVDFNISGTSSYFNDIIIPAQNITAFSNTTENNYNEWKNYINSIDYFDFVQTGISQTFITKDYPSNIGSYARDLSQLNKSIFVLKTGISNIYYPVPSNNFNTPMSQIINPIEASTQNGLTSIFGTIILNDSVIRNSNPGSTTITYRAFTNDRTAKNLLTPAQTSIHSLSSDADAAGISKFFNFYYTNRFNVLSFNSTTNINYHNGVPFSLIALQNINFNPSLVPGINSFNDTVVGIKPFPVYEYTSNNLLII